MKNWAKFQHYRDRDPPWIKLYKSLLDDYDFCRLQDASKLHLVLIWLYAARNKGEVPNDPKFLQNRLSLDKPPDIKALITHGFLISASNALADCKQSATPETYTQETYTQETEKKRNGANAPLDDRIDPVVWAEFEQHRKEIRKPLTDLARSKNTAILAGLSREEQRQAVDTTIANRWTGLFTPKHKQPQPQRKGKLARAMESYNARHGTDNRGSADRDVGAEPRKLTGGG